MSRLAILFACVLLGAPLFAADAATVDSKVPAQVGPEILQFLQEKYTFDFDSSPVGETLAMQFQLTRVPLQVATTQAAKPKTVTYAAANVPLVEALRTICEKSGTQYRISGKTMRIATPDEWKLIDAGSKTFEELEKESKK